ncbi:unnamed protein product [Cylindrotheca closterium]|uniref:Glycerol-3-phosphate dehydrogenase n=1 Tax=Cylindrotheca closterium TaxID=2856 RepID=A0AAD2JJ60_9STRA|nr:unnamed protein product [Cylindrotheca closterium]
MVLHHQHGVKGVYRGGEWLDIEDCDEVFTGIEDQCSGCKIEGACPRSRSRPNASSKKSKGTDYDVVIIGAGCVGAAVARELSRYDLTVLMVEAADDVTQGATKGNSGIVHAGYDDKPGTNRSKYCWPGNQMFPQLDRELNFGYQKNGSLVLATNNDEVKILNDLLKRGETNGVKNLRIIDKKELFEMEKFVNPKSIAALYSPDAGNVIPYEFTIALAENAVDNGVELRIRREVTTIQRITDGFELTMNYWEPRDYAIFKKDGDQRKITKVEMFIIIVFPMVGIGISSYLGIIQPEKFIPKIVTFMAVMVGISMLFNWYFVPATVFVRRHTNLIPLVAKAGKLESEKGPKVTVADMKVGGSGSKEIQKGLTMENEKVTAKFVINCAGSYSDQIARMIGDKSFKIKPRLGDYLLLNRNQGHLTTRTLFPCPDPVLGKGVLVQTTLWGNLILGPTARDTSDPAAWGMKRNEIQHYILSKCKNLLADFDPKETIHAFCGARAKSDRGDWIIENSSVDGRMIHVAGIDSPGLAGSPAIALEVVRLLEESGCELKKDPTFNPRRAPIITPKNGMRGLKMGVVGLHDSYDQTNEAVMAKNVICKCEKVTELEVVRALRRSLPIDSSQGIRKRTRAGMGHCQGDPKNYNCEARVRAIIARETGMPMRFVGGRPWPATSTLMQRWPQEEELNELERLKM